MEGPGGPFDTLVAQAAGNDILRFTPRAEPQHYDPREGLLPSGAGLGPWSEELLAQSILGKRLMPA